MATPHEIAREYFPDADDGELEHIIWGRTGFPSFWPDDERTPEENFRAQLQAHKDHVDAGRVECPVCEGGWISAEIGLGPCSRCNGTDYIPAKEA